MSKAASAWPKPVLGLVANAYSKAVSDDVAGYVPDDAAWDNFERISREILQETYIEAGACTLMSALLAQRLTEALDRPFPVVAGALKLDGAYMYGSNKGFDGARTFSESAMDWDGHCWVLFGAFIADISLGRTARTGRCRALLTRAILSAFGDQVGLIAVTEAEARRVGLLYLPRYVLTPSQIGPLAGGAMVRLGRGDGQPAAS